MKNVLCAMAVLVSIFIIFACQKAVSYSAIPQISLNSYTFVDTVDTSTRQIRVKLLTISLHFTDGDGDLFTQYPDTSSKNLRSKIHLSFYKKENGIYTLVPDSFWNTPYNFTFPYSYVMDRSGQNKTQKGTIEFSNYFFPGFPFDTAQVECSIMDIAGNQSNKVRLPKDLVFK